MVMQLDSATPRDVLLPHLRVMDVSPHLEQALNAGAQAVPGLRRLAVADGVAKGLLSGKGSVQLPDEVVHAGLWRDWAGLRDSLREQRGEKGRMGCSICGRELAHLGSSKVPAVFGQRATRVLRRLDMAGCCGWSTIVCAGRDLFEIRSYLTVPDVGRGGRTRRRKDVRVGGHGFSEAAVIHWRKDSVKKQQAKLPS